MDIRFFYSINIMDPVRAKKLIHERNEAYQEIYEHETAIQDIRSKLEKLTKAIYETCDHEWGPYSYAMYEKPSRECNICGSPFRG